MEKKEDRRIAMTKRMLKDALTEMLRETDIYHVSIRELCQRADINRTTFYKYYGNQFDLLADMENDMLEFLSETIRVYASNQKIIIRTVCEYLETHLEFARLIINNNVDPLFPQKIFSLEVLQEAVLERYRQNEAAQEYLFNYLIYGAYRVISLWLNKEQREPPEQIAQLLMRFTQLE
ncbi:MAG: TetR/AcrR family transcriptional regulator [Clostridia bacterium]|nr:TetR/AcrR family transcriptional regulator [Clostridia bacterium]